MTSEDLAAIRAAHYPMTGEEDWCVGCQDGQYPCDVVALLAEVDRLTAQIATAVLDRTVYPTGEMVGTADRYVEDRLDLERARIRAAVEGLTAHIVGGYEADCDTCIRWSDELQTDVDERGIPCDLFDREGGGVLNRAAVLAAIEEVTT